MTLPVGSAPPLHVHDDLDDTWYILEGQMVVRCGDDELVVGAGHWVSMPRGVPHTFRVVGDHEARILLVHDNASFRDLVRELGTPATARTVPSQPAFPPMDELARIAASHDLRPIGPPMSVEDSDSILAASADRRRPPKSTPPCKCKPLVMSCSRSVTCNALRASTLECWACRSSRGSASHGWLSSLWDRREPSRLRPHGTRLPCPIARRRRHGSRSRGVQGRELSRGASTRTECAPCLKSVGPLRGGEGLRQERACARSEGYIDTSDT